jgi:hypothetical protein
MSDQLRENLRQYEDMSFSYTFTASTDYSGGNVQTLIADKAGKTLYITQITLSVTTDNAAIQTWQDTTAAPIAGTKASPGKGPIIWDFGQNGFALPTGKGLQHLMSATGMAGTVTITAYRRDTVNA